MRVSVSLACQGEIRHKLACLPCAWRKLGETEVSCYCHDEYSQRNEGTTHLVSRSVTFSSSLRPYKGHVYGKKESKCNKIL